MPIYIRYEFFNRSAKDNDFELPLELKKAAGCFLMQDKGGHLCRFFLLREYHGNGLGSKILKNYLDLSDRVNKPVRLCYLQGNRVGSFYFGFGFHITSEDQQIIYMERAITYLLQSN